MYFSKWKCYCFGFQLDFMVILAASVPGASNIRNKGTVWRTQFFNRFEFKNWNFLRKWRFAGFRNWIHLMGWSNLIVACSIFFSLYNIICCFAAFHIPFYLESGRKYHCGNWQSRNVGIDLAFFATELKYQRNYKLKKAKFPTTQEDVPGLLWVKQVELWKVIFFLSLSLCWVNVY